MGLVKKVVNSALGFLGLISLTSSLYIVDQNEHAVVTRFGNPKRVIINPIVKNEELLKDLKNIYEKRNVRYSEGPGLKVKLPFIDKVNNFERRLLSWDGNPEQMPTLDKRYIFVDPAARWYIYDPLRFMETVKNMNGAQSKLDDIIDSDTRNNISSYNLIEAVRNSNRPMQVEEEELKSTLPSDFIKVGRDKIDYLITQNSRKSCKEFGIYVEQVLIKRINYVENVKESIEQRMIAERKRIAEKYRSEGRAESNRIQGEIDFQYQKVISEANKDAQKIKGSADALATKIYADAFKKDPKFYELYRTLTVYEKLGSDSLGQGTSLIIGTDNDLFKYLKEKSPKK